MKHDLPITRTGALALALIAPFALAQDDEQGYLLGLSEYTAKTGHYREFQDGIEAWIDCYKENGGTNQWSTWYRMQGDGTVYTVASTSEGWADMSSDDEAAQACHGVVADQIRPHLKSTSRMVAHSIPELSKPAEDYSVVEVHNFQVKDAFAFRSTVSEISSIVRADEDLAPGVWYDVRGGRDSADFFLVTQFADMSDFDQDRPGVWALLEKHSGKEKAERLREQLMDATDEYWSYVYSRVDELSHPGSD